MRAAFTLQTATLTLVNWGSQIQLNRLQSGDFTDRVKQYLIIDCRFSYEFEGGHIAEAVNLPTVAEVEQTLLETQRPPEPSTSEAKPIDGKTVLIFHCEFSAKRAPTRCACLSVASVG